MKILICGTRKKKDYAQLVFNILNELDKDGEFLEDLEIIEGCCFNSADEWAEVWCKEAKVKIHHFPSTSGNYLKRNIEMVEQADRVIAFWDKFSYGTCHAIATAVMMNKPVKIIDINKVN